MFLMFNVRRMALRIYGGLAGLGGIAVLAFGPSSVTDGYGAMLMVTGCFACALSQVVDPYLRRKGFMWFAGAHAVIVSASSATWTSGSTVHDQLIRVASWAIVGALFSRIGSLYVTNKKEPAGSRYEQQMRQAGAQEERNRLARDLHDSIKQQIFVIQTAAATAQTRFDDDRVGSAAALDQIRAAARDAMTEMEVMMDNLRSVPLENAGLVEALKKQCEALGHRTGARVEFKLGDVPATETVPPGSHQAIFRVAQEALANIGRHARAGNVTVSLGSSHGRVELGVQDDGTGFDQSWNSDGMGLANMRARAAEFRGRLDLTSAPRAGTTVAFSIPYLRVMAAPSKRRMLLVTVCLVLTPGIGVVLLIVKEHRKGNDLIAYFLVAVLAFSFVRTYVKRRAQKAKA